MTMISSASLVECAATAQGDATTAVTAGKASAKSVNFHCECETRSLDPAEGDDMYSDDGAILTLPYKMEQRSRQFRGLYGDRVGCSVQGKKPGLGQLGINPHILSVVVKKLGFVKVDELRVESDGVLASSDGDRKLNMLFLMTAKLDLALGGPNYLVIKPFVGRMYFMCSKWHLVQSLRRMEDRMLARRESFLKRSGRVFSHEEFTPDTLNLNNKDLENILFDQPGVYLAKPVHGSMGERQQLVRIRSDQVREDLLAFLESSEFLEARCSQVILQRYIDRPLLVDRRKFDLRVYMLVVNARRCCCVVGNDGGVGSRRGRRGRPRSRPDEPGYFVFMHPGFLRLCTAPYDPLQTDLAVHLTNQSVQAKRTSTFRQLKEVTTWYPDELNSYLNRRRRLQQKDWAKKVLYPKVGAILGYISAVFQRHLDDRDCPTNTFRILGVDFLVDEQLRVYLLEFNSHPSWGRQTSVLDKLKPNLWREAASVTSEVILRYRDRLPVRDDRLVTRQDFRLIYSSEDPGMARLNIAKLYD